MCTSTLTANKALQLTRQGIENQSEWENRGYTLPCFDIDQMVEITKKNPTWIHFGAGNLFKAFPARILQDLLNENKTDTGVIITSGRDFPSFEATFAPHDNLSLVVTLNSDGTMSKDVIASIAEALALDFASEQTRTRLQQIFANPSLQMATMTITEKGYVVRDAQGSLLKEVKTDIENGPDQAVSYMGKIASLLLARFLAGGAPIAMVSMDNCSANGDRLKEAIETYARGWCENSFVDQEFVQYVSSPDKVSFPCSMIDKITPRPCKEVEEMLRDDNVENLEPVVTARGTYIAPFVNAEETEYLVIEDRFPNGRPPLEQAGVLFCDRKMVEQIETMKVTTCLNPLHTALAIFGMLLGFDKISDEMKDSDIQALVKGIGYDEGLPVVVSTGLLDPKEFLDTVLEIRLPNPFIPDCPQRIACDTSQKLSVRYGHTIAAWMDRGMDLGRMRLIPLTIAAWLRYLTGINDKGEKMTLSSDPLLDQLQASMKDLSLTSHDRERVEAAIAPLLENEKLFGVNLAGTPLKDTIINDLTEMLEQKGSVRSVLHNAVKRSI